MTSAARAGLEEKPAEDLKPAKAAASRRRVILPVLAVIGLVVGSAWYVTHHGRENTDDAQVDGEVVAIPSRISATVTRVHFIDNQEVKAGDLLVELDDAPAKAHLAQAEAALASAIASSEAADAEVPVSQAKAIGNKDVAVAGLHTASVGVTSFADQIAEGQAAVNTAAASLAQAKTDFDRSNALFATQSIAKAELDRSATARDVAESNLAGAKARLGMLRESANQAKSRVVEASARVKQSSLVDLVVRQARARADAAHAEVDTAKALRDLAALDVSYTKISAPRDGEMAKKTISEGQAVAAGQPIAALVTPLTWVIANFKETQMTNMRVGQPAEFTVDAYPSVEFSGDVESISGATGARFTLLAPDNASGNFTKIVQRIPVRIHVKDAPAGVVLRPGMSVDLTVDTRK